MLKLNKQIKRLLKIYSAVIRNSQDPCLHTFLTEVGVMTHVIQYTCLVVSDKTSNLKMQASIS